MLHALELASCGSAVSRDAQQQLGSSCGIRAEGKARLGHTEALRKLLAEICDRTLWSFETFLMSSTHGTLGRVLAFSSSPQGQTVLPEGLYSE